MGLPRVVVRMATPPRDSSLGLECCSLVRIAGVSLGAWGCNAISKKSSISLSQPHSPMRAGTISLGSLPVLKTFSPSRITRVQVLYVVAPYDRAALLQYAWSDDCPHALDLGSESGFRPESGLWAGLELDFLCGLDRDFWSRPPQCRTRA